MTNQTEYFAYLGGRLVDKNGFITNIGPTAFTRSGALSLLRAAKKRAGKKFWGRLDYIVYWKGNDWTIIHNDKF